MPLDAATSNPMALDVAADGRVFYVDRLGDVKVIHPAGGTALSVTSTCSPATSPV
jgi:hypothetical protein